MILNLSCFTIQQFHKLMYARFENLFKLIVKGGGETDLRRNSWQIRLWQPDTAQRYKWNGLVINFVCFARRVFQKGAVFVGPALPFLDLSEWMGVYLNWIADPMYNTIHRWRNNRWSEKELGFGERDYLWISGERAPKRGKANIAGNSWKKAVQLRREEENGRHIM